MAIKTFWIILLKIIGICFLLQGITLIQQLISLLFIQGILGAGGYFLSLLVNLAIYLLASLCFLFKTNWLIKNLKLEKGFNEDKINLNIKFPVILNIAIIVLGAVIILNSLPALVQQLVIFFQQQNMFAESPVSNWIIFYCIEMIAGCLMLIKSKQIAGFFYKGLNEKH